MLIHTYEQVGMSRGSSSSIEAYELATNGPMPLTRCPKCPRLDPLVRCTTKRTENGNFGREFVKCESKAQAGKVCTRFAHVI